MSKNEFSSEFLQKKMSKGIFNLVQDRSDFLLPHVVDLIVNKGWLNIQPEYQRRRVWDNKRKSRLIESILMNIPIPPIFLLETNYRDYEVMDGQQRLDALVSFFDDSFVLSGLTHWAELNDMKYSQLPKVVQRGLERRRISAVTVMVENFVDEKEKIDLRSLVFERLNTGGMKLNPQEIRNCVYFGDFNNLIIKLASKELFTNIWNIPMHEDTDEISEELAKNAFFRRMGDCEIVLRFFALSEYKFVIGSLNGMLDDCMKRHMSVKEEALEEMESNFINSLNLAVEVFGDDTFKLTNPETHHKSVLKNLYDAVMVVFHELRNRKDEIIKNNIEIKKNIISSFERQDDYETLSRRKGSATEIVKMKRKIKSCVIEVIGK